MLSLLVDKLIYGKGIYCENQIASCSLKMNFDGQYRIVEQLRLPLHLLLLHVTLFLCRSALANPLPQEGRAETLRVAELSFSEKLENPCAFLDPKASLSWLEDVEMKNKMMTELRAKTILLKDNSESILKTFQNDFPDCSSLELPSVAIIPSLEEMKDRSTAEALSIFYTSLLNHTAHVYFIPEQLQSYASSACATSNPSTLETSARSLAAHMRELMCIVRLATSALQDTTDFSDSTAQILNEQLVDQPLCARRTVRNCQTVRSTVTLLHALASYLQQLPTPSESSAS